MTMMLIAALLLAQQNDPPSKDAAAAEALEKFKTAYKSKEISDRATAVAELCIHSRVIEIHSTRNRPLVRAEFGIVGCELPPDAPDR